MFWDGDYVSQLPYVWYLLVLRAVFNMLVRNASPRGPMCFRCLMFNLSGPCFTILLARGWCATVKRDCANCILLILPLRRHGPPVFLGSRSCDPAAWLAERQLLAGDIESNPGSKLTLKNFYTHSLNPPHSIIHQSNHLILPTLTLPSPLTA